VTVPGRRSCADCDERPADPRRAAYTYRIEDGRTALPSVAYGQAGYARTAPPMSLYVVSRDGYDLIWTKDRHRAIALCRKEGKE
jgi:hypothetical protein